MQARVFRLWLYLLFCMGLWLFSSALTLKADDRILAVSVSKDDPAVLLIHCACVSPRDEIQIYFPEPLPDNVADNWSRLPLFRNTGWVIDVQADGSAELLIQFIEADGSVIAYLYDDQDGDGQVSYRRDVVGVTSLETSHWSAQVVALPLVGHSVGQPSWFLSNGSPNTNITALLDGPRFAPYGTPPKVAERYFPLDGVPDLEYRLVDADHDGRCEYATTRVLAKMPPTIDVSRFGLNLNGIGTYSKPASGAFLWPFLNLESSMPSSPDLRTFDELPVFEVDWETAQIQGFGMRGYPVGHGYNINSILPVFHGQVNSISFEMPHAYYDLAGNRNPVPDLNVRMLHFPPGTSNDSLENYEAQLKGWTEIRYSWNLFHPEQMTWDYKLGMMGNYEMTPEDVVQFPEFALQMVPFDALPYRVTNRTWDLVTFVAQEGRVVLSSEGIYLWTPWEGPNPTDPQNPSKEAQTAAQLYLLGEAPTPPRDYLTTIVDGYRGEYNYSAPSIPTLYLDNVDHKLHLRGAEYGVWNIDDRTEIRYDNLDHDNYLDQWRYLRDGALYRQLNLADGYLIYAGEDEIVLKQVGSRPPLFEGPPPRNHQEWRAMGQQLNANRRDLAPGDLRAMVAQFGGPEWHLTGAALRDFRLDGAGFRFVLELQPGFRISGAGGPDVSNLQPGNYVVTYGDSFSVTSLTPVDLSLAVQVPESERLGIVEPTLVRVVVLNRGREDALDVTLAGVAQGRGEAIEIGCQRVDVLAGKQAQMSLSWQPTATGPWEIRFRLENAQGELMTEVSQIVDVAPGDASAVPALLSLSSANGWRLPAILVLLALSVVAGVGIWAMSRPAAAGGMR